MEREFWKDALARFNDRLRGLRGRQPGATTMANPNDPQLMQQKRQLGQEIEQIEAQMEADPDNEDLEAQIEAKLAEMKSLNDQLKAGRVAARDARKVAGGQGRATAPGQQKKQP